MCTVAMGSAEMAFVNVIRVTLAHDVIFHVRMVVCGRGIRRDEPLFS